jgi:hypothetical protein
MMGGPGNKPKFRGKSCYPGARWLDFAAAQIGIVGKFAYGDSGQDARFGGLDGLV